MNWNQEMTPEQIEDAKNFYNDLFFYLDHNRCCDKCGERLWLGYADGHVWDECLKCLPNRKKMTDVEILQELAAGDGYLPCCGGYIGTTYPIPTVPMPDYIYIEASPDKHYEQSLPHERYYRKKR